MDVLNQETKDIAFIVGIFLVMGAAFMLLTNPGFWMPEWVAIPLFTGITQALEATAQPTSVQAPLQTPQLEEELPFFVLEGVASSGNQTFNISATLRTEL